MANVSFYLKNEKKPSSLIFARFSFNYFEIDENGGKIFKQLKQSTGEKINPLFWDKKKQRARETKEFPQFPEFNTRLNNIENVIKDVYRKMLNDKEVITPESLKRKITEYMIKENMTVEPQKQQNKFTVFIKNIIDETKRGERTKEGGVKYKNTSIISYNNTLNNLLEYEKKIKKTLKFSDITINFYSSYTNFLNDKNLAVNTIGGNIKNIKMFMQIATDRGLNDLMDFKKRSFKKVEEESQTIYLNTNELQKIYELDLSNNKRLESVRDIFIIGCYTGLRFSDLKQLGKEHFYDDVIKIETKKTENAVIIPLYSVVREICNKYGYNLPRVISNQKMNEYIKELGKLAEIDETIILTETRGGMKSQKNIPKYELITVHTARRSYATNMYKEGFPIIAIRMITGHKTERAFLKYIKIDKEENAKMMLQHPYFNQLNNLKIV